MDATKTKTIAWLLPVLIAAVLVTAWAGPQGLSPAWADAVSCAAKP